MKIISKILLLFLIGIMAVYGFPGSVEKTENKSVNLVMCRPAVSQIKNIVAMRETGIVDIKDMKLLCVYHRNELTDYKKSFDFVAKKNLRWVEFIEIRGNVSGNDLFKKNLWSSQFYTIFNESDGIIFTGGMDIPPVIYGEKNRLLTVATSPVRSMYEVSFLFHLIGGFQNKTFKPFLEKDKEYPVLGICLGAQSMNVAAGGTLYQDIPSEIYKFRSVDEVLAQDEDKIHSSVYKKLMFPGSKDMIAPAFHRIKIRNRSVILKNINGGVNNIPYILSSHHQAVEKRGKDLFVAAGSMDGKVIEALEHKKFTNVLGVQFHPEPHLLYKGIQFFTGDPENGPYFTLKSFLMNDPSSLKFHKRLWEWFAGALKR
ncbi:MAG: gamma-glutamyl-gamma-aminobutyrate hydrolase family protein [Acidobacteriota bacterium]